MLSSKIEKIEVAEIGYFSTDLKVTSTNGEVDILSVDTLADSMMVMVDDTNINSYKLVGEKLTDKVEKTTGALAGGHFKLHSSGAYLYHKEEKEGEDICFEGQGTTYTIYIGDFKVIAHLHYDILNKASFEIIKMA